MKAVKSARFNEADFSGEAPRRGTKLTPNKKSGKQRHHLYQSLEQEDELTDEFPLAPRESILDYIDDDDQEQEEDEDEDEDEQDKIKKR